jgi:GNAT superfamily N-acetyltransferase
MIEAAMGREAALVEPRFARGCRCFAVMLDSAVAGYGWLSTGPEWIGEIQLTITPRAGEGYIWNCVTLAPHRRKGVFRSLLLGITEIARRERLTRLWIGSVAIPAERAVGPSGFRPALRFDSLTLRTIHVMTMRSADSVLAREARAVLRAASGRLVIRRSRHRRH